VFHLPSLSAPYAPAASSTPHAQIQKLFAQHSQVDNPPRLNPIVSRMTSLGAVPKVLFIGNSLTYFNNGLWTHVKVSPCVALQNVSSIVHKYPNSAALLIL
jgi:hypothetical protein